MAAYLQQGHGSWGLMEEDEIGSYDGLVLSPVNDGPEAVRNGLSRLGEKRDELEVILDPQLYNPSIDKGKLSPKEVNERILGWFDEAVAAG